MSSSYTVYKSLENATVFVSGGASGIGREIVYAFAAQKSKIGVIDIDEERGLALERALSGSGVKIRFVKCDLRDVSELKECVEKLHNELGPASVLVNNAARDDRHNWKEVTEEFYNERIATNLRHMFFLTQAVAPGMVEQGKGSVINLGSNSWWEAAGGMPVYTTSKAAVHGMTRSFARDLGPHRIRVNTVVPGWIMTERQKALWVTPESLGKHLDRQCLPDPIRPEYVAKMVLFLASDEAAMCTAQNYMVDAGSI